MAKMTTEMRKAAMKFVMSVAHNYADEANVCWSSALRFGWFAYKEEQEKRNRIMRFGTRKQREEYFQRDC